MDLLPSSFIGMNLVAEIRAVAARRPAAPALYFEKSVVSFGELVRRMDGLALALRERGVGDGAAVGILLPRAPELIVALLGVLAAGAAYVPLDATHPAPRLLTILNEARPGLLLTDDEGRALVAASGVPVLLSRDWPPEGPAVDREADGAAYIMYTSGSTGTPKGVEVGVAALANYVRWAATALPFSGGGVPLFTSIAFDHAVTNIFPPLVMGEPVYLLPSIAGGRDLAAALLPEEPLNGRKYSYVKITPSLFAFLSGEQRAVLGRSTELLMFGGEALAASLVVDARRNAPQLKVLNHYGPTEATVGCCVYDIPLDLSEPAVPIGKPITGAVATVRRGDGFVADALEMGELFIGGAVLANGYWQRPDLTAQAFVWLDQEGGGQERWYRTGDLARLRPDGAIDCLGRADGQVKILGNRIEPAEIVAVLNALPGIRQAAVFGRDLGLSAELVAVLVFNGPGSDLNQVRKHLHMSLPPAMVPAHYLFLEELPLGPSGKLDVKQLLLLLPVELDDLSIENAVEQKFRELLALDAIGPDDDYFLLGGDSLGTVEMASWASERYGIHLELSSLFDHSTIAAFSAHIKGLQGKVS